MVTALPLSHTYLNPQNRIAIASAVAMGLVSMGPASAARVFSCTHLGNQYTRLVASGNDPRLCETLAKLIVARTPRNLHMLADLAAVSQYSDTHRQAAQDKIVAFLRAMAGLDA